MLDGLYKVHFAGPLGTGSGVIVLSGDGFMGGDGAIAYTGTFKQSGSTVEATLMTFRHTAGVESVLGTDIVTMSLTGAADTDTHAVLSGQVAGTGQRFQAELTRLPA